MARPQRKRSRVSLFAAGGAMRATQAFFGVAEHISPRLAAPIGQRVWFHVPSAPPHAKRDRGFPPGRPLEVSGVAGGRIRAHEWGEGPTIILVHGWSGWWQQLGVYVQPLVDAGFRVVAYDAPSHGDSDPGRFGKGYSSTTDLADAVEQVARSVADGHPYGLVCHSVGCTATGVAFTRGVSAERVAMIAPSVSGGDQVEFVARRLGWGPRTTAEVRRYVARKFGIDIDRYTWDSVAPERVRELPPALFVHDGADQATPPGGSQFLHSVWPNSRLVMTEGLGHFHVLWDPETVTHVAGFMSAEPAQSRRPDSHG